MKRTHFFLFIVTWILTSCAVSPSPLMPEDYVYTEGLKVNINISSNRVGIQAKDGADDKRIRRYAASNNLSVVEQYPGGIYILQPVKMMGRYEILELSRSLLDDPDSPLIQAGFVAKTEGAEAPLLVTDEIIIQFKAGTPQATIKAFFEVNTDIKLLTQNIFDRNQYLVKVRRESERDALVWSSTISEHPAIEFSHPNFVVVVDYRETIPNDTLFNQQWPHRNTGQSGGTVDADVDTSWAWDINQGANAILIAVIDSGFDAVHQDLTPNLWTNPGEVAGDGIDNDGNGFVDDINGWDFNANDNTLAGGNHGTAVAGVAAARGANNQGVSGSCPNCSLMLIRNGTNVFSQGQAFGYAQMMGANIINNSWGYSIGTPATANIVTAINNAAGAGSIIFFAMNNGNRNDCTGATPDISSLANVIAISAVSNQDRKVTESAFGNCMELVAPTHRGYGPNLNGRPAGSGVAFTGTLNVPSTDRSNNPGYNNTAPQNAANGFDPNYCPAETGNRNYTLCFGGTSAATPLTAGVAGLALSANPALTRVQMQRLLQDTADKVEDSVAGYAESTGFSSTGGVASHGYGRVNAFEAVRVVAPLAQGGRNGTDVFIRDNRLDWGNTEQPSNILMEPTRGFIPHYQSVDIKVDHPPYQSAPTTSAQFDAFSNEDPVSEAVNKVYVRVHNRGPTTADTVTVKLHWAFAGTALPQLPADFWTAFPGDSADPASRWTSLGSRLVTNLAYSGSSVAGSGADASQIVQYDFIGPPLDPSQTAFRHYCLFAVLDSTQDPVLPSSRASLVPDFITPRDNNITHRNVALQDPDEEDGRFSATFYVRNPYGERARFLLELGAPEGWKVAIEPLDFNKEFSLDPNEEFLVKVNYAVDRKTPFGDIEIQQHRLIGKRVEVIGGMSYRIRPQFETPEYEDCIAYDADKLHVVNEGAKGWLLTDGLSRMLLLSNESDADAALKLARQNRYQCFIGRDNSRLRRKDYIVQYWK